MNNFWLVSICLWLIENHLRYPLRIRLLLPRQVDPYLHRTAERVHVLDDDPSYVLKPEEVVQGHRLGRHSGHCEVGGPYPRHPVVGRLYEQLRPGPHVDDPVKTEQHDEPIEGHREVFYVVRYLHNPVIFT